MNKKNKFPKKKYQRFDNFFSDYITIKNEIINSLDKMTLIKAVNQIEKKIKSKKNIFICGNGGSAAISNHYVADYLKYLKTDTKLKPKFISLVNNLELITAISNDISFDQIFSYQLKSLAKKGDLLILISSSGNSRNLINALDVAKKLGVNSISFVGFKGGKILKNSELSIHAKINNYGISEDISHILMHIIVQYLRQKNLIRDIKKIKF